ncbi:J domain of Hsj1a, partial [Tribonema minus]
LGVSKTASDEDIRKAYRREAVRWHPDKNAGDKGAEERFKHISEAYDTLKDRNKRFDYDSKLRRGCVFTRTGISSRIAGTQ